MSLSSTKEVLDVLAQMVETSQSIVGQRAALRHDLMGRIFHRLLAAAKYLATFYTSIPSATLLLKLALRDDNRDWSDLDVLREFKAADLACGTGTLLMACADAMTDKAIRSSAQKGTLPDLTDLHRVFSENVLHGYDVLPSAIHLTASTLSLRAPQIAFKRMNLYNLPLGGPHKRLGSVEYLKVREIEQQRDLFGGSTQAEQASGKGPQSVVKAAVPQLDFCVMNPPFARSMGGNLLFGSLPEVERKVMQKDLADILRRNKIHANSTAGLGAVFVAIGHRFLKEGGRIALVLPKALLSGVAWNETRQLLRLYYVVEWIIVSHDPQRWNFSESTELSEVMLVARRLKTGEKAHDEPVRVINLSRNVQTAFEALAVESAARITPVDLVNGQGTAPLRIGQEKVGEIVSLPWSDLRERAEWIMPAAFAQTDLLRLAYHLGKGELRMPGEAKTYPVPLCQLKTLGDLGPDARDVHDAFEKSSASTPYPAFWSHNTETVASLSQKPNDFLSELSEAKPGRPRRLASQIWPHAGNVMLAERLRLNNAKLYAVRLNRKSLSNTWWTFAFHQPDEAQEKALVLWLNSSLAIAVLLMHRVETEGPWVKFKSLH